MNVSVIFSRCIEPCEYMVAVCIYLKLARISHALMQVHQGNAQKSLNDFHLKNTYKRYAIKYTQRLSGIL